MTFNRKVPRAINVFRPSESYGDIAGPLNGMHRQFSGKVNRTRFASAIRLSDDKRQLPRRVSCSCITARPNVITIFPKINFIRLIRLFGTFRMRRTHAHTCVRALIIFFLIIFLCRHACAFRFASPAPRRPSLDKSKIRYSSFR